MIIAHLVDNHKNILLEKKSAVGLPEVEKKDKINCDILYRSERQIHVCGQKTY